MRPHLLTELTAKTIAGVAAVTLAAGSAGAVVATRTSSHDEPIRTAEVGDETTTTAAEETTTTTEADSEAEATTTTEAEGEGEGEGTTTTTEAEQTAAEASTAHPDNFGARVSEDARDGGVDGQEIAAAAQARNEERKAAQPHPATRSSADDRQADDQGEPHGTARGRQ